MALELGQYGIFKDYKGDKNNTYQAATYVLSKAFDTIKTQDGVLTPDAIDKLLAGTQSVELKNGPLGALFNIPPEVVSRILDIQKDIKERDLNYIVGYNKEEMAEGITPEASRLGLSKADLLAMNQKYFDDGWTGNLFNHGQSVAVGLEQAKRNKEKMNTYEVSTTLSNYQKTLNQYADLHKDTATQQAMLQQAQALQMQPGELSMPPSMADAAPSADGTTPSPETTTKPSPTATPDMGGTSADQLLNPQAGQIGPFTGNENITINVPQSGGNATGPITIQDPVNGDIIINPDGTITTGGSAPAPGTQTPAPGAQTPAPGTQTPAPGTQTPAPGTQTPAPGTQTPAPETQTPAPGTQTPVPGTQTPVPGTQTPAPGTQTPVPGTQTPAPSGGTTGASQDKDKGLVIGPFTGNKEVNIYINGKPVNDKKTTGTDSTDKTDKTDKTSGTGSTDKTDKTDKTSGTRSTERPSEPGKISGNTKGKPFTVGEGGPEVLLYENANNKVIKEEPFANITEGAGSYVQFDKTKDGLYGYKIDDLSIVGWEPGQKEQPSTVQFFLENPYETSDGSVIPAGEVEGADISRLRSAIGHGIPQADFPKLPASFKTMIDKAFDDAVKKYGTQPDPEPPQEEAPSTK